MLKNIIVILQRSIKKIIFEWNNTKTIVLFFVLFFVFIVETLFTYTVLDYNYYTKLADGQQIGKVTVPVNRGTIHSGWDRSIVMATSLHLYDLAIDPQMKWDKQKLADFLTDIVYTEICEWKTSKDCESSLSRYLKVLEIEDFENDEDFVKKKIADRIISRLVQTKVTSALIDKELNKEEIESIKSLHIPGLYPTDTHLYVNPEEFNNNDSNVAKLAPILNLEEEVVKNLTRKRDLRYVAIINKLSIESSDYIEQYIKEESDAIQKWVLDPENSIGSFFIMTPTPNRYYPEGSLAAQIIGFVDNNGVGNYWIEWYFNDILKWNNWEIISRKDTRWRIIDTISLNEEDLLWEWVEIHLTIDRNIQKKVEEILALWVRKYLANRWMVTIMNPHTWEVIAMANFPTFDLNNYWDVYELEKVKYTHFPNPATDLWGHPVFVEDTINGEKFYYDNKEILLREATREELWDMALVKYRYKNADGAWVYRNNTISSLFEPGSIIKPLTVAIWIDTWEIDVKDMYNDEWFVRIDNFKIKNVSRSCLWYNSFQNALNWSCNVWMIRIAQKYGRVISHQYLKDFWIWELTWIELQWEANANLEDWEKWSTAWLFTRSYWLWISLTQLQMAAAYNVLANWWVYMKPKIIDKIVYPDWKVIEYKPEEVRRVIKESTSRKIIDAMYDGTRNGIGLWEAWKIEWYRFALKSWTAQIAYKGKYETWPASTVASFAWFGPIEDPQFVMVVTLDRPRTSDFWDSTSAKIWQEISEYLVDYLEIPKRK